jgi:hypothetical protein
MVAREVGNLEEAMDLRILPRKSAAAIAGVAMLAASSASSPAFTLSAPSIERPVAAADVESIYWRAGWHGGWHRGWHGGWHRGWGWRGGWHRWGWGPRWGYGWGPRYYGFGPAYRCWWTPWGFRRCGWV